MAYKYLYIDDTDDKLEQGTINGLQDGAEIEITFKKPNDWETQIIELKKILPDYNGIILDLRLNDVPYEANKYAQYRGSTVAQELRTLAKESVFKNDFPIILISANDNLQKSLDQTSFDLFDFCVSKNKLEQIDGVTYAFFRDKLKWLADGYAELNNLDMTILKILKIANTDFLDGRFVDEFNKTIDKPAHIIARFLAKELIEKPGILINENYLAARLGIDQSSEDWNNLKEKYFTEFKYSGVFSNYNSRWWADGLINFWGKHISKDVNIRNIQASKRVELIIDKTGFKKLTPILKQDKSKSESFWVVCKATHVAIDTIDGFVITGQDDNYPWQEPEYISLNEALRPTKPEVWKNISSVEKPRLQKIKSLLEKNEQRGAK